MNPNPGSDEAVKRGCICPVEENLRGLGVGKDRMQTFFTKRTDCPLHGFHPNIDGEGRIR